MTALAGIWSFGGEDRRADCERMLKAQQLYGPSAPSNWSGDGVNLGRRLFPTLPEDRFDRGPAVSLDGRWVVIADARLDNRDELIASLEMEPAQARQMPESAVILAVLERWGDEGIVRLIGDFAFAAWDGDRQRLLLARDYLGQRPLHYHFAPHGFAFASMPKGLHALAELPREPDVDAVTRFLMVVPDDVGGSYFKNIRTVPAAHICSVSRRRVELRRYWNFERPTLHLRNAEDYQEAVRESLDRAVAARLRGAEGRLATHLSGGLDSSAVTATAARAVGAGGKLTAFTAVPRAGYDGDLPRGRFGDEGAHAASVARLYPQIDHVLIRSGEQSPVAALDRNFFLFERPVLNLCNHVWVDAICEAAQARRLSVLLTGQRGNMSFSYSGMEHLAELLARGRLLDLASLLRALPKHRASLASGMSHALGPFLPVSIWRLINRVMGRDVDLSAYSAVELGAAERLARSVQGGGFDTTYRPRCDSVELRLAALGRTDTSNTNKGQLGAWGVDVRDPTGDRRVVELCLSIPTEQFIAGGEPRALARGAFSDRLPEVILRERRKGLQAIDWHEGMQAARSAIGEELERFASLPESRAAIDTGKLRRLVGQWPGSGWNEPSASQSYRLALLRGVSAGHFIRKATGANV